MGDISSTDQARFVRIADPKVSHGENDLEDIPKPQERIKGSLVIRDTR